MLDAATLSAPPRLRIYETLIAPDLARSQHNHAGIPFLLLDYLVVTSLLLTTTTQEWLDRPADAHLPGSSSRAVKKWLSIIHPERVDEMQKEKEKDQDQEDRESISPGGTLGPGSSIDSSTPVTPSSSRGARLWEAHMSWSSGSGSGGSETIISPSTPGTSLSSNSPHNLPPRYSGSHLIGMHSFNYSQSQFGQDMSGSYQESNFSSPPQRRFQVANPEPTPDYDYKSAPDLRPQQYVAVPAAGGTPEASPRPSTASHSYAYAYDSDFRPSTASSASSLNAILPTPPLANPAPTGSVRRPPRQLPRPPVLQDPYTYQQQQNGLGLSQMHDRQRVSSTPPSFNPGPPLQIPGSYGNSPAQSTSSGPFTPAHSTARSLARRSLGGRPIPPPPPPPLDTLPLPPKLAAELANTPGAGSSSAGDTLAGQMRGMAISPPPPQTFYPPSAYGSSPDAGSHVDAGRVRASFAHVPRDSDAESVYEMPPPAYDAIDFTRRLPGQTHRRAQ